MPIQQTKKQSDVEKRLQILRRQAYGKDKFRVQRSEFRAEEKTTTNYGLSTANSSTDLAYLNRDLLKILIFSSLAIGTQLVLFFLTKNNILNLNLF